ncbi:hypothetical protein [Ferrovum sp.]|uniref:hypothetical protein n=1 Tax=Ferrovum sp. TaxID=2609467 RepID=UPI002613E96E|nr:hypothetical protein [Ferrovum sp.]MBW8077929.1 hypothetical protein [Gallionella sp.]
MSRFNRCRTISLSALQIIEPIADRFVLAMVWLDLLPKIRPITAWARAQRTVLGGAGHQASHDSSHDTRSGNHQITIVSHSS